MMWGRSTTELQTARDAGRQPVAANMEKPDAKDDVCTYLEWDSHFFGHPIARLNRRRLGQQDVNAAVEWCTANGIECLYFLADPNDPMTSALAEKNNFMQVDVRMTFERPVTDRDRSQDGLAQGPIRPAAESDLQTLKEIARTSHRASRFYFDHHFQQSECDALYETWIEKSVRGYAQAVLVAQAATLPAGYISCHLREDEAQIGLAAVSPQQRAMGVGTKLTRAFLAWAAEQGATRATVVTQGRNLAAQRLYQRNGFITAGVELWYHRWFLD